MPLVPDERSWCQALMVRANFPQDFQDWRHQLSPVHPGESHHGQLRQEAHGQRQLAWWGWAQHFHHSFTQPHVFFFLFPGASRSNTLMVACTNVTMDREYRAMISQVRNNTMYNRSWLIIMIDKLKNAFLGLREWNLVRRRFQQRQDKLFTSHLVSFQRET